jgi:hypothetical protein
MAQQSHSRSSALLKEVSLKSKFERERSDVESLLALLDISMPVLSDANAGGHDESGADVVYACGSGRIGIQVTDYVADEAGEERPKAQSRAVEKRLAAEATKSVRPSKGYGMTAPADHVRALKTRIKHKLPKSMAAFSQKWLLIVAQKDSWGAGLSTFFAAENVDLERLNVAINPLLAESQYNHVFVLLQSEKVVIEWTPTDRWRFLVDQRKPLSSARIQELRAKLDLSKRGRN